jgi:hypothetical protein
MAGIALRPLPAWPQGIGYPVLLAKRDELYKKFPGDLQAHGNHEEG